MDWYERFTSKKTVQAGRHQYDLTTQLFERFISDNRDREYHTAWIATTSKGERVILKAIQEVSYDPHTWKDEVADKFESGLPGMARNEQRIANELYERKEPGVCASEFFQRDQRSDEEFPGRKFSTIIFYPQLDDIDALDKTELRKGFGEGPDLDPKNASAQALEATLRELWKSGYEYQGSYQWLGYSKRTEKCYLFDYTEIYPNGLADDNADEFNRLRALLYCNIPRPML